MVTKLAMWSGPRNLSTALMRSFGNRSDTHPVDEPLYASYLAATGLDHPGREAVIAAGETDWDRAVTGLAAPLPPGTTIQYEKHMTHHVLPGRDLAWVSSRKSAFLIRHPRDVLTSYVRVIDTPSLEDLGLPQQAALFDRACATSGVVPPVVDARDLLLDPRGILTKLCTRLGIDFEEAMLTWPPGPRATDGCWAPYWYESVWASTGFAPYREKSGAVPGRLTPLLDPALEIYRRLHTHRIRSD